MRDFAIKALFGTQKGLNRNKCTQVTHRK